jgi:amino acid transporter
MPLKELLFGRRLRTEEEQSEQIGLSSGIPVVGLDALASAAYGPEAALTLLLPLGTLAVVYIGPITILIIAVLFSVAVSYRQTIEAYPQGGGSYTVAKENLGTAPGLLAASALCIDYVLNVAVAISAGVGALVSAVPALLSYTLPLCLIILIFLTIVNLRGVRSAGLVFMFPTYLFIGCLGITIFGGIVKTLLAHGHPIPVDQLPKIASSTSMATAWLLMRAFASGCTALTGVEAVSNAVPIFREPRIPLARRTLAIIVAILAFLIAGVAILSHSYGITATPPGQAGYQSVLSQMVIAVSGRGAFYFVSMAAILLVVSLSADTSFTDFPRVCRLLALDQYLPAVFAHRGRRLVYSYGIVVLSLLSGILLLIFGGITDRLIPMFAVGAFTAFTLSQLGMVFHWRRSREPHAARSLLLNGTGAVITGVTLVIITISKFLDGAWLTILVIPLLILLFIALRRREDRIAREIDDVGPLKIPHLTPPIIVIPMQRLDALARKALWFAFGLSPDIRAVQILAEEMKTQDFSHHWRDLVERPAHEAGYNPPKLVVVLSAYREYFGPLLGYIKNLSAAHPGRSIAVIVPEFVEKRWYHFFFPHRAALLKNLLHLRGGPHVVIIDTPWYLHE